MKLTVIVPMLNEARALPQLLPQLQRLQADGHQLLLVDGGSDDVGGGIEVGLPCTKAHHVHALLLQSLGLAGDR